MDHRPVLLSRRELLHGAAAAALSAGALGTLACSGEAKDAPFQVGGLPVTCNLTLPIACEMRAARNRAGEGGARFAYQYSKYNGWPEIKESLMAGRIQAAY